MAFLEPVSLVGSLVRLDPLTPDDDEALGRAAADGELWRLGYTSVPRPEDMAADTAFRLGEQARGTMLPFVTRRLPGAGGTGGADGTGSTDGTGGIGGEVIGATTYCRVDATHRRVEIGYTWNARSAQRSGTNTDSKLLLLTHAFETLDCIAVEFRTHFLNRQSRAAIERLGARQDGILRHHQLMADGSLRDTVVYSITAPEWPAIRAELRRRLERP